MDNDSITIFQPHFIITPPIADTKIASIDHCNTKTFVFGDNRGQIHLYQANIERKGASMVVEPIRLGKDRVTCVVSLSTSHLLVAAIMDSNLFVARFVGKSDSFLVCKGVVKISFWPGEQGKLKLFALTKNKGVAFRVNLEAPMLSGVLEMEKVFRAKFRNSHTRRHRTARFGTRTCSAWDSRGRNTISTTSRPRSR